MKQLQVVPQIFEFDTFGDFAKEYNLSKEDLILTNKYIDEPVIKKYKVPCHRIYQEEFGNGEPSDLMINGILKEIDKLEVNRIIAVGGGTIIDIAKILSVADDAKDVNDLYDKMANLKKIHQLIVIPTTCGTGSEVTNISIVNRTKLGTKQGLVSEAMYPEHAVLIPEFIETLPYGVFATSSIDALIHAIESMLSPLATCYTRLFSRQAIEEIIKGYILIAKDKTLYKQMGSIFLKASNYAGIAFGNAGCGTVHAMSYAFGGKYHVAHGESNYQFLIPVLQMYKDVNPSGRIAELEELLSTILNVEDGINGLEELLEEILTKKPMKDYGAIASDVREFTDSTLINQERLLSKSYIPMDYDKIFKIYSQCL